MRLHSGTLDVVGQLMRRFPGRHEWQDDPRPCTWVAGDIGPFVAGGASLDAVMGARVQQAAACLAVTVYTTLGKHSLDQVLATLPAPFKELVWQKVAEETGMLLADDGGACLVGHGEHAELPLEDDDADSIEGLDLCITGVAIRAPAIAQRANLVQTDVDEEDIMDEILEDTGMVFQGSGLTSVQASHNISTLDDELRKLGFAEHPCVA